MDKNFNPEVANSYETYNYLGQKVYIASYPLTIKGLDWSIVAMRTNLELLSFFRRVQFKILLVFILVLIISLVLTKFFRESIIHRLNILKNSMSKLVEGINAGKQEIIWHDELGETIEVYNGLNTRINNASDFALQLSEGNYDAQFESQSDKDSFGKALNTLKQKLLNNKTDADKRAKEDTIRNWTNEGIAKFNDLLRQSNNDIKNLSYILIENLVEYLGANLGGVYIVEGESENTKAINLVASYAYDRRKYTTKTIEIGEGLIGNCYLEKKPIHLRRIPEDYIEISSGLGKSIPRALYIAPLMLDQEVLGFLEIASVEDFEEHKIDFVNKLSENIAATFATVNLNSKTAILLEESKRRSNEIAQQEEEMRQNLEEMQATQEELARIRDEEEQKTMSLKREIENSRALILQLVNQIEGEVVIKDSSGFVVMVNNNAALSFNTNSEKLLGKPDSEIFLIDSAEREHESDMQVVNEGSFEDDIAKTIDNQEHTYHITKKPFYLPLTSEMGIISIRIRK
jgi:methyl-accepting chemotaxis protein